MKKWMVFFPAFLLLLALSAGCSTLADDEEIIYLKTNKCYLPIYVRGNKNASTYIIWTHGGPGSSAMYYGDIPEIAVLHKNYRIAYWDQMGSGASTGNPDRDDYNIDEFSRHQGGIIKIIRNRYHPEKLILLGHSWGGFLSSYYLIAKGDSAEAQARQDQLDGLILLNPVLDIARSITESVSYIRDEYAPARISEGKDVYKWLQALLWYDSHLKNGLLYGEDIATHYQYIEDAGGMLVQRDRNDELTWDLAPKMIFFSPFQFYDYYHNQETIRTYLDVADKSLARADEPNLTGINLPTLMIAGEKDRIAFQEMSEDWFEMLGSHDNSPEAWSEYFRLYQNCAHACFLDAADQFKNDVISFITTVTE